jgi:hypothetical protein
MKCIVNSRMFFSEHNLNRENKSWIFEKIRVLLNRIEERRDHKYPN